MIKRTEKGFTLLEVMIAASILVFAITAALKVYLDSSLLVSQSQNRTRAVTHAKMIAEQIRSWADITDESIAQEDWLDWLTTTMQTALLTEESVLVQSENLVDGQSTSPRKVSINISWQERGRAQTVILVGGMS